MSKLKWKHITKAGDPDDPETFKAEVEGSPFSLFVSAKDDKWEVYVLIDEHADIVGTILFDEVCDAKEYAVQLLSEYLDRINKSLGGWAVPRFVQIATCETTHSGFVLHGLTDGGEVWCIAGSKGWVRVSAGREE